MDSYRRYGPALLRKARRLLRNDADALDVVQSLFLELFSEGRRDLELPFLYRALTNRCLNLLRDERNRARLLERESPALRGTVRIAPDTMTLGLDTVLKLSARVPPAVLETLVYRFVDELGQQEIAAVMGVSRKTVQNRLAQLEEALAALAAEGGADG